MYVKPALHTYMHIFVVLIEHACPSHNWMESLKLIKDL